MICLADTHIALWAIGDPSRLPNKAKKLIQDSSAQWFFSYVSAWEVAVKHAKRPNQFMFSSEDFCRACRHMGIKEMPLQLEHIYRTEQLPFENVHGDPFDRMLLAQAKFEDLLLVTHDKNFAAYDDPHVLMV